MSYIKERASLLTARSMMEDRRALIPKAFTRDYQEKQQRKKQTADSATLNVIGDKRLIIISAIKIRSPPGKIMAITTHSLRGISDEEWKSWSYSSSSRHESQKYHQKFLKYRTHIKGGFPGSLLVIQENSMASRKAPGEAGRRINNLRSWAARNTNIFAMRYCFIKKRKKRDGETSYSIFMKIVRFISAKISYS